MLDVAFADEKAINLFDVKRAVDTLTMHVLAAGIFGQDLDFNGGRQRVAAHNRKSLEVTQRWILQQLLWIILFGNLKIPAFLRTFLPSTIREVLETKEDYQRYMAEFAEELQYNDDKTKSATNLITTIIQSNDKAREDKLVATGRRMYLTDHELYANLFILNMAGFETTATTLGFTIPYLAAYPAVQRWLVEEIDSVTKERNSNLYDEVFPQLTRMMAVMYETLRLRGALQHSFKVNPENQTLELSDRELVIPGNTYFGVNAASLSRDPQYWGPDSEAWRPSRWIEQDSDTGKESLKDAPEGTIFVPWTVGPRVCPGKKFSQVEFTGTILTILSRHRLEAQAVSEAMHVLPIDPHQRIKSRHDAFAL
ncbi:hypothetical protein PMZ80_010990 [Knufia obscura]|uniref:Cytochrome P450 n=1 Tax=Knufia obscura TaxID=1635080 RepID=A0ABR0R8Z2_9EURO|nr:hypothetical protein PMZ80_010990 [Knufia obscura]